MVIFDILLLKHVLKVKSFLEYVQKRMPDFELADARRALRELHNEYKKNNAND